MLLAAPSTSASSNVASRSSACRDAIIARKRCSTSAVAGTVGFLASKIFTDCIPKFSGCSLKSRLKRADHRLKGKLTTAPKACELDPQARWFIRLLLSPTDKALCDHRIITV